MTPFQITLRPWALAAGTLFTLASCSASGTGTGLDTPPSEPTHHAVVEGSVVDAQGQALHRVGVGARFAESSPLDRQVSVIGGAYTEFDGAYRFAVEAISPHRSDGLADFYVHATLYAAPGGLVRQDSILVTARFVPIGQAPHVVGVPELRLPDR